MSGVVFTKFENSGSGQLKVGLGLKSVWAAQRINAVELTFTVDPAVRARYSKLKARQWLGPEAHWVKRGSAVFAPWLKIVKPPPTDGYGDDPKTDNVLDQGATIVYYDNPGPSPYESCYHDALRIQVVQNFTGWIEGTSRATGAVENLVDAPAAWFSVIDLYVGEPDKKVGDLLSWDFTPNMCKSGTGWRDVTNPPPA